MNLIIGQCSGDSTDPALITPSLVGAWEGEEGVMRAGSASYVHQSRWAEQSKAGAGAEHRFPWAGLHHLLIGGTRADAGRSSRVVAEPKIV